MTKERATMFFAEFYNGEHHFPGELKQHGTGWAMHHRADLASWDYNSLTRLVVMAHDEFIRVSILPCRHDMVKVVIHPRAKGWTHNDHPALDEHIQQIHDRREKWLLANSKVCPKCNLRYKTKECDFCKEVTDATG